MVNLVKDLKLGVSNTTAIRIYITAMEEAIKLMGSIVPAFEDTYAEKRAEEARSRAWQVCGFYADQLRTVSPHAKAIIERKDEDERA